MRTLGSSYLALLLQGAGTAAPEGGSNTTIVELIARASPISKVVLVFLALFSIYSWAIILYKLWTFRGLPAPVQPYERLLVAASHPQQQFVVRLRRVFHQPMLTHDSVI